MTCFMTRIVAALVTLALLLAVTTGSTVVAGHGILHGFVVDSSGQPVTELTAVVTHLEGQFPFSESQELTASGEFVVGPTVGSYLVELQDESGTIVAYRTGINIFNNITTFLMFDVDLPSECQTNIGHGHSGGMTLSLCGDDLTTAGGSADLSIYNATPNAFVYMPVGLTAAPVPFEGGTLVPFPWLTLLPLPTSNTGTVEADTRETVERTSAIGPPPVTMPGTDSIFPNRRLRSRISRCR